MFLDTFKEQEIFFVICNRKCLECCRFASSSDTNNMQPSCEIKGRSEKTFDAEKLKEKGTKREEQMMFMKMMMEKKEKKIEGGMIPLLLLSLYCSGKRDRNEGTNIYKKRVLSRKEINYSQVHSCNLNQRRCYVRRDERRREDEEKNSRQSELDSCSCTRFVLFSKSFCVS